MLDNNSIIQRIVSETNNLIATRKEQRENYIISYSRYKELRRFFEKFKTDISSFVIFYAESNNDNQVFVKNVLRRLYHNQEHETRVINQIRNLYYLNLNHKDHIFFEEQYNRAISTINSFLADTYDYLLTEQRKYKRVKPKDYDASIVDLEELKSIFQEDKIVSTYEDIDLFVNLIYSLNLTLEEKEQALFLALQEFSRIYSENLTTSKKEEIIDEDEEEVSYEIIEQQKNRRHPSLDRSHKISQEVLDRIEELLRNETVLNKIMLAIDSLNTKENPKESTTELVEKINAEETSEVLEENVEVLEEPNQEQNELREKLFDYKQRYSSLSLDKQLEQIKRAYAFYSKNKELLNKINSNDKKLLDYYVEKFTEHNSYRDMIFSNKTFCMNEELLLKTILYELELIFKSYQGLDPNNINDLDYISKISARIEDLIKSYQKALELSEYLNKKQEEDNHLFFLKEQADNTYLEEDIKLYSKSANQLLADNLELIATRYANRGRVEGEKDFLERNKNIRILEDLNVKYKDNNGIRTVYIPIDSKRALIIGTDIISEENDEFLNIDKYAKRIAENISNIRNLKNIISISGFSFDILKKKATEDEKRINGKLGGKFRFKADENQDSYAKRKMQELEMQRRR